MIRKATYTFISLIILMSAHFSVKAQYVEPEENVKKEKKIFPTQPFDSLAAKRALSLGTATIKGEAFVRQRDALGIPKVSGKIRANQIKIELFPYNAYIEEWLELKKKKENPKKFTFVYMDNFAYRYRLEAVTNSVGKFTFPEMKPGKYYLRGVLGYTKYGSYNKYTGSGYNSYGYRTDYYTPTAYSNNYSEIVEAFVEITKDGEIVEVKVK